MHRMLLSLALFTSTALIALAQDSTHPTAAEQTILKLEQQWEDALTHSDTAALNQLYDATLIYTHSNGKVDSKSSFVHMIETGATKYQSMNRDDIRVHVYSSSAIVSCHWDAHVMAGGNKIDLNARYLHVYVKQGDSWKLVAHESTKVAP